MRSEDRRRVEELFEAALELPPERRSEFLAGRPEDPELLVRVRALLRAHDRPGGVLDRAAAAEDRSEGELIGRRVGPYRLLEVIGRGGMGVVYLAERADGHFRRHVAVKVLRPGGDPDLPARMIAERQILAGLDHPSIAKLLDGGVTEDGRPYLVMEHVAGLPIDVYCDRMRLAVPERIRLFLEVVDAVEHAHRNLVVHRDLKPSNVLVAGDRSVKLLDFGIAKLLNPSMAGFEAPVTLHGERVLTPEYASPEQLRGEGLTTASDVYSLGVVLYRLLTGGPPHRTGEASLASALALVLEEDPAPPSRSVSGEEVAANRSTTPDRLRRELEGDLDAIVLKTLRRDPSERYRSAERLGQDLEAYLGARPVEARRGSRWYRIRKLARRHRYATAATVAAAASLLLGAAVATWQASIAGRERDRVAAALAQTERALAQSNEVTDFLMELFRAGDPERGGDLTARELLRRGSARADALSDHPVVQARMLDVVGQMHHRLGRYDEAEVLLSRAVDLRRGVLGPDHPDLAESLIHLARVRRGRVGLDRTLPLVEEALRIRRAALPPDDPLVGEALHELGWLRTGAEQERLYREALAVYRASGTETRKQAELMHGLSTNLRRQGRLAEAVAMDREALALAESALGPDHSATAYAMIHLADQVRDIEGDAEGAERLYREGLALQQVSDGPASLALIHGLHSLAELLSRKGEHDEAQELVRRALTIRLAATGADHPSVPAEQLLLALHLARGGRAREAREMARRAVDQVERLLGRSHPAYARAVADRGRVAEELGEWTEAARLYGDAVDLQIAAGQGGVELGEDHRRLGRALAAVGRYDAAERALLRSLELLTEVYGGAEHPNLDESRRALHDLYVRWSRPEMAARYAVSEPEYVPY